MIGVGAALLGSAGISGLSSLFASRTSAKGQAAANAANLKIAREQMTFQERMSSSAHQREVKDLRAAGLNPILSATGGRGASTPAGQTATMQNEAPDLSNVGPSAMAALRLTQDLKNLQATNEQTKQATSNLKVARMESLAKIAQTVAQTRIANNAANISDIPGTAAKTLMDKAGEAKDQILSGTHPIQETISTQLNDGLDLIRNAPASARDIITREYQNYGQERQAYKKRLDDWKKEFTRLNKRRPTASEVRKHGPN
ncbi:hypothetical protein N9937_02230 [bacterium]|nr:hypothetical protein [bacterium]